MGSIRSSVLLSLLLVGLVSPVLCRRLEEFNEKKNFFLFPTPPTTTTPSTPTYGPGGGHGTSTPSTPTYGPGGGHGTSTPSTPTYGPGGGHGTSTPSTPTYGPGGGHGTSTPSTPSYGTGGHGTSTPSYGTGGHGTSTPSTPSYGTGGSHSTPSTPSYGNGGHGSTTPTYGSGGNHATPTPSHGSGSYNPPSSGSGGHSTPTVPSIDPHHFFTGTCDYWRNHPQQIYAIIGYWSTVGQTFGPTCGVLFGTGTTLHDALSNARNDGFGSLIREGTAAFLNSIANSHFPFTTQQVQEAVATSITSDGAAAAQADLFKQANEGKYHS
ncbi:Protodermal factor 1 [Rhynchospora pubera]|uniref:Protodermal factor 1 n=1 Tax=Rhynchospora pubera TaxID=906938 RepID=A0AAV8GYX4_9POAL|nr:Protodermal factor 1 [Rhynchospora pubera]